MRIFKRFHKGRKFTPADAMAGAGTLCGDGENSNAPEVAALAGMLLFWHPPPPQKKPSGCCYHSGSVWRWGGCPVGVSHSSAATWEQQAADSVLAFSTHDVWLSMHEASSSAGGCSYIPLFLLRINLGAHRLVSEPLYVGVGRKQRRGKPLNLHSGLFRAWWHAKKA